MRIWEECLQRSEVCTIVQIKLRISPIYNIFNNYFQFSTIESSLDSKSAPYHWRNELNFTEVNVSSDFFLTYQFMNLKKSAVCQFSIHNGEKISGWAKAYIR